MVIFSIGNSLQLMDYYDVDWVVWILVAQKLVCAYFLVMLSIFGNVRSKIEFWSRVMSLAYSEIVRLLGLLGELGIPQITPTPLRADNTSAIQIVANLIIHDRTKHIEVDCQSIRKALDQHEIKLPCISIEHQTNDFLPVLFCHHHQFMIDKLILFLIDHNDQPQFEEMLDRYGNS